MLDFMFEALVCLVLFSCPSYLVHANLCLQFHMVETLRLLVSVLELLVVPILWHDTKHDILDYTEHLASFQVLTSQ